MLWPLYLLILQAVSGGFDVLRNHGHRERLPPSTVRGAATEHPRLSETALCLSFLRTGACAERHGRWAYAFILVLTLELLLTAWDFIIEDRTRTLSASERTTHMLLNINDGVYLSLLLPRLWLWADEPDRIATVDYKVLTSLQLGFGLAILLWGFRDLFAGIRLTASLTGHTSTIGDPR